MLLTLGRKTVSSTHMKGGHQSEDDFAVRGHEEVYNNGHSSTSIVDPVIWEEVVIILLFLTLILT